jgi:hypothetical protein
MFDVIDTVSLNATGNHHVVDLKLKPSHAALLKHPSLACEQHKD